MRILWLNPYGRLLEGLTYGCWVGSLLQEMVNIPDLKIAVTYPNNECEKKVEKVEKDGVSFYPIFFSEKELKKCRFRHSVYDSFYVEKIKDVVSDFNPDIIHIWGSEFPYGLISKEVDIPCVLHLQGILNPYLDSFFPPGMSILKLIEMYGFHLCAWFPYFKGYYQFKCSAKRELIIFNNVKFFLGRTNWDYSVSKILSPNSFYFYCSEMLRAEFRLSPKWRYRVCSRLLLVSTISSTLYKGGDVILKTAKILKSFWGDDFEWCICGVNNLDVFERFVGIRADSVNVHCMGVLKSSDIVNLLIKSDVYCHLSYVENSPVSVCEAQYIGIPIVATDAGGTSSILQNGAGLIIPPNDPYQAAYSIVKLKKNKDLSTKISMSEVGLAEARHNTNSIVSNLVNIYNDILKMFLNGKI